MPSLLSIRKLLTPLRRHVLDGLPEFTVCEECYDAVVWPLIEDNNNTSDIARSFLRSRQYRSLAACQLYSNRMRDIFRKACRRNDMDLLISKVKERLAVESEIRAKYSALLQWDQDDPTVERERLELARRLKEIE